MWQVRRRRRSRRRWLAGAAAAAGGVLLLVVPLVALSRSNGGVEALTGRRPAGPAAQGGSP